MFGGGRTLVFTILSNVELHLEHNVRDRFWWALVSIGVLSVVVGLAQLLAPAYVLALVATETSPLSRHLVASLGMLVALFGGMFLYAIMDERPQHVAVLWTGIQKLGTATAVGLGVQHAAYIAPMVCFALFDLVAGVMIIGYWYHVRQQQVQAERP
jgi:hypothetical protein